MKIIDEIITREKKAADTQQKYAITKLSAIIYGTVFNERKKNEELITISMTIQFFFKGILQMKQ